MIGFPQTHSTSAFDERLIRVLLGAIFLVLLILVGDIMGRTTSVEVRDNGDALVQKTAYAYSADHHSVTTTIGTGADAISSTTFTDTTGAVVLSINGENQKTIYARNQQGLVRQIIDPLSRVTRIEYDALDRPFRTTRPDGSFEVTAFEPAGNLTDRIMNNALGWFAQYDAAGRQTLETTCDVTNVFTRLVQHTYLSSGANTGLRNTTSDQRGVTFTHAYDDFRRLESITALRWQLNAGRRVDD